MSWVQIPPSVNVYINIMITIDECNSGVYNGKICRERRGKKGNNRDNGINMSDRSDDMQRSSI